MTAPTILVGDDDGAIRTVVSQALGRAGFEVRATGNAATLWRWISDGEGDLVITDVVMPDENGLDLIPRIRDIRPELRIVVMSAHNTLLTAVKATERGAFEYLSKPFDINELVNVVRRGLESRRAPGDEFAAREPEDALPLIGRSPVMQEIYRTLARLMGTDLTVMINGESGTGKELVARALHNHSPRAQGPFIAINIAAIPGELLESELFGHEKGAFTGAQAQRKGRFEQANGGTLFLDEIGELPLTMQSKLLRVLQERAFERVGGGKTITVQVRLIAATNLDLDRAVAEGRFREDLYYRLKVVPIRVPPLRERKEDIPLLVDHFLKRLRQEHQKPTTIVPEALARLVDHHWPGNVRELENTLERLVIMGRQPQIQLQDVTAIVGERPPAGAAGLDAEASLTSSVQDLERQQIVKAMEDAKGVQAKAAKMLGITPRQLGYRLKKYGLAS